jgi:hypothetical protein
MRIFRLSLLALAILAVGTDNRAMAFGWGWSWRDNFSWYDGNGGWAGGTVQLDEAYFCGHNAYQLGYIYPYAPVPRFAPPEKARESVLNRLKELGIELKPEAPPPPEGAPPAKPEEPGR